MSILTEKWAEVLDHAKCPRIADERRREVTAILLENQAEAMRKEGARVLSEGMVSDGMAIGAQATVATDGSVGMAGYDKVLRSVQYQV